MHVANQMSQKCAKCARCVTGNPTVCLQTNISMASVMDVEMPARYFINEGADFYHDFHGECEDCGRAVPEWSLSQCQYGFCGKFFCQNCGFRCRRCGDYEARAVTICSSHARLVYPPCDGCQKQFCDVCTVTSVTQVCIYIYFICWRGVLLKIVHNFDLCTRSE